MSRTYVDYAKVRSILVGALGECDTTKLSFDNDYQVFESTPALRVACRMVRALASDIVQFDKLIKGQSSARSIKYKAIIIPGPDAETVRVFTNMVLDNWDAETELKVCSPYMFGPNVLKTLATTIMGDLADPRKAKAWEGTNRCLKRLKRSEVMPVARALTRYTNASDFLADHQIRSLADVLVDIRKPMELIYADEPHQFVEMYGSGPASCMSHGANGDGTKPFQFLIDEHNSHPTAFFAFHPYTRGVYVKKRNRDGVMGVAARCMIYQRANGEWEYGRIYTNGSDSILSKFTENLEAAGIRELNNSFERDADFDIPGYLVGKAGASKIELDSDDEDNYNNDWDDDDNDGPVAYQGDYAMPVPYFDNLRGRIKATWDKATKTFHVKVRSRNLDGNVSMGSTSGYITADRITVTQCDACRTHIGYGTTRFTHQTTGAIYCSHRCVQASGNVVMLRSDGQAVVRAMDADTVPDHLERNIFYTNMAAATRLGARPASRSVFVWDEEEGVSRCGYNITDAQTGDNLMITYDSYSALRNNGYMTSMSDRLRTRRDFLRDMEINVQKVTALTFNTDEPLVVDTSKMVVPANFNTYPKIHQTYAVSTENGTDQWGSAFYTFDFFTQAQSVQARAA